MAAVRDGTKRAPAAEAASGERRRVQSIEVGFRVLQVLRLADGALPLREIAAAAGMTPSKAHLYLVSFVREGMAYQDPGNGYYGLGPFAIQLGLAAIRQLDVVELAIAEIRRLRDETSCAVYLTLWGDRGPCIVAKADGSRQGAFSVRLGFVLPVLHTATGLAYLANMSQDETRSVREADPSHDDTPEAARKLVSALADVRKAGFAYSSGHVHANFAALAAPLYDLAGQVAAVITVLGPADFVHGRRRRQIAVQLLDTTRALSSRLGAAESAAIEQPPAVKRRGRKKAVIVHPPHATAGHSPDQAPVE